MRFAWSVGVILLLLGAFVGTSFRHPVAAYCGMYPAAAIVATLLVIAARQPRPITDNSEGPRCTKCGYSLKGLIDQRCPECGQHFQ